MATKKHFINLCQRIFIFLVLFGCASHKAISSSPIPTSCSQVKTKWDLWRAKTCLRGANIWQKKTDRAVDGDGFGTDPVGPPYTQKDFDTLSSWGANYVNISHPGLYTETAPYKVDPDAVANLDALLVKIAKANLYAVISFRTGPGKNEASFSDGDSKANNDVWKSADAQNAWVEMWKFTAQRYAGSVNVVGYDLMVEPNSNAVLLKNDNPVDFYSKYKDSLYDFAPLARNITKAIRSVDENTPVLVGTMDWSSIYWLEHTPLMEDTKTVYTIHHYAPYEYTHQTSSLKISYPGTLPGGERFNSSWLANYLKPVATFMQKNNAPVAVNEFGVMRWEKGATSYLDTQMSTLENSGVSYAYWLWESSWKGITYNEFDYRKGTKMRNQTNQTSNDLIQVLKKYWKKNLARPKTS